MRYIERFIRLRMRKPDECSGIEGITFIHDFRDESIRCVRRPVRVYARAHKADTHTRAVGAPREDARVVARMPLRGCRLDYQASLTPQVISNVKIPRIEILQDLLQSEISPR